MHVLRFGRVSKESAFHKYGRDSCLSQDVITAASHSAIWRRRAAGDKIMDSGGERQTVAAIEIRFDAVGANAFCRVEMDADKNGVLIRVRN